MLKEEDEQAYFKLAQLLATSDISSIICEKYAEPILHREGNINYQLDAGTVFRLTKLEDFGCTLLHILYKKDKLKLFKLLLNHGAGVSIKNQRGSTILHQIIEDTFEKDTKNSVLEAVLDNPYLTSALDALVKSGNDNNSCNKKGITHFHIACMANHKLAVDLFLKGQLLINQSVADDSPIFPGYSAFHFAAKFSNLDIVEMLLEYAHDGAAQNIKDAKGMTPLHILLQSNIEIAELLKKNEVMNAEHLITRRKTNEDIICLLLSKISEKVIVVDDTHLTRLHIDCIMESSQLTDDLLDRFKYLNQAVNEKSSVFSGNTALHFAALCNVEKLKLLLKKGANICIQNAKKQTAFDLCLERYEVRDIYDIIASQPKWNEIEIPIPGKTILDMVSCLQTLDLSPLETKKGMLNACISKKSPLWPGYHLQHLAVIFSERDCRNDSMIIEKMMKDSRTTINRFAKLSVSPLHLAFRLKRPNFVRLLLSTSNHSYINCLDTDKLSHLHIACAAGVVDAVEKLLLNGAEVNAQLLANFEWFNSNLSREVYIPKGSTPLHVAVIVGNYEVVKILLDNGADLYARDEHEMTPIHWIMVSDNPISPVADILLSPFRAISMKSSTGSNKRIAIKVILKECITSTGLSHLHVACFANNPSAVQQLLDGTDLNINRIFSCKVSDDVKRFPGKLRYAGYTPLHLALEKNHTKIVHLLLQRGAQVLMKNIKKNSIPLYEAFNDKSSPCSDVLISFFKNNEILQKQLEQQFGLNMLHFYCHLLNYKAAEKIIKKRAVDVNNSIIESSPIWPGYTPLHVLVKFYQSSNQNADGLLKLLLNYGADVTVINAEKNTPLHMAYDLDIETNSKVILLKSLLKKQKSIIINPQNNRGLTHFHILCALCDLVQIQRFWKPYDDVNQTVDYFYGDENLNGSTPLHLVLHHPLNEGVHPIFKVKAVSSLIENGAVVNVPNIFGNTALHLAAKYYPNYITLLKKIVDVGGNIYARNILGETPFEIILNSEDVSVPGVKFFLDNDYPPNSYNPITQKGFIAMTISSDSGSTFEQQQPVLEIMMEVCGTSLDRTGRTIIHNIVSTSTPHISGQSYNLIIELLAKSINIDYQDNLGRTALHIATQFKNHLAVFALLQAGADLNITDENDKTAFAYAFENSTFFEGPQDNSELIVRIFSQYVQKLNVCQLEVHEMNHSTFINALTNYNLDVNVSERFYDELDQLKNIRIKSTSITFLNIISGTNNKSKNLLISVLNPIVLIDLGERIDKDRFCETLGVFRLQCRKYSKNFFSLE